MSVLECGRMGCERVMCDRLILNDSRYICRDCWEELKSLKETWEPNLSRQAVERLIREFMDSVRSYGENGSTEDNFAGLTGNRWEYEV